MVIRVIDLKLAIILIIVIMMLIHFMLKQRGRAIISSNQLSVDDFKSFDEEEYEIYYVGVRRDDDLLKTDNFKLLTISEMARLIRQNDIHGLPFDNNKLLIVVFQDAMMIKQFNKFARKFNLKYCSLGDYETYLDFYTK